MQRYLGVSVVYFIRVKPVSRFSSLTTNIFTGEPFKPPIQKISLRKIILCNRGKKLHRNNAFVQPRLLNKLFREIIININTMNFFHISLFFLIFLMDQISVFKYLYRGHECMCQLNWILSCQRNLSLTAGSAISMHKFPNLYLQNVIKVLLIHRVRHTI